MNENEKIEMELLLQAIYLKYGYDFRDYSKSSVRRRIIAHLSRTGLKKISSMQHKLLYDEQFFKILLLDLTVNVTEMFRDPTFFKMLRKTVIPELKKQSFIKIWHAGCSSGEEVYSLAIILKEGGLDKNIRIYATDVNEDVLSKAKKGVFDLSRMKKYTHNYIKSGGLESFGNYYIARYNHAIIDNSLKKNILFSEHNLVTDGVFGEMDLIICRNVLIYFNRELQNQVFKLFWKSLKHEGFLCLGSKETICFSTYADDFETIVKDEKIFRKKQEFFYSTPQHVNFDETRRFFKKNCI